MDDFKDRPPPKIQPTPRREGDGANGLRNPAERAKQVMFWVLAGAALGFWLLALVESRSIIGATVATLVLAVLYTVLAVVARRNDLGGADRAVQWVIERGWRGPDRTFRLAVKDLRSAVRTGAAGRARACPQQRLGFAPATLQALEREMTPTMMADLATDAFADLCEKGGVVFDDPRPVRVFIGSDQHLGAGQWSRRYVREGEVLEPVHGSASKVRSPHPGGRLADDEPTQPYADVEATRAEFDSHAQHPSDPDITSQEPGSTMSFSTLTLITDGAENPVTGVSATVGRESTCDIVLPSPDNKIHRHHATITHRADDRWWLVPRGAHGVRVGQVHYGLGDEVVLSDQDTIAWGRSPKALRSQVRIG